jgi:hypothetical protein
MQKLVALLLAPLLRAAATMSNPDDAVSSMFSANGDDDTTTPGPFDEEGDMASSSAKWGVEYYSLRVLEKAFSLDSAMAAGVRSPSITIPATHTRVLYADGTRCAVWDVQPADGMWEACESLLVADHAWVRTVSARLLGLHFAAWQQNEAGLAALSQVGPGTSHWQPHDTPASHARSRHLTYLVPCECVDAEATFLAEPGRLFKLARKQAWMLTAPSHLLPPALLTQLLKNLLFLSLALHANPGLIVMPVRLHHARTPPQTWLAHHAHLWLYRSALTTTKRRRSTRREELR